MPKTADSDLYDDLYGTEEDNGVAEEEQLQSYDDDEPKAPNLALPARPSQPDTGAVPDAAAMSYSAQVARQFSEYQQTPSQERQPQFTHTLPQNPRPTATPGISTIATHISGAPTQQGLEEPIRRLKPSEMHEEGKMFVGGLNWDTTDDGLKDYFSEFGKVDACTIMRDPDGRSRGFAFMTFEDAASVAAVVSRQHYLDGKAIDPKRAIPREEHLRNTRYFVGGLAPATTGETMKAFFATWGKVVDATVMVDRESGRSKGFGFVTYEDATNADQLIGQAGLVLDDKQIEVKAAQARSQRDAARTTPTATPTTSSFSSPSFPGVPAFNGNNMTMGGAAPFVSPNMGQQGGFSPFGMPMGGNPMMNNPMMMAMYQRMMSGGNPGAGNGGMNGGMNAMMNPMAYMNMMNMMGGMGGMMGGGGGAGMNPGVVGAGAMRMGMGPLNGAAPAAPGTAPSVARPMGGGGPARTGTPGTNPAGNTGSGPVRTNRGGHGYHPYAR